MPADILHHNFGSREKTRKQDGQKADGGRHAKHVKLLKNKLKDDMIGGPALAGCGMPDSCNDQVQGSFVVRDSPNKIKKSAKDLMGIYNQKNAQLTVELTSRPEIKSAVDSYGMLVRVKSRPHG